MVVIQNDLTKMKRFSTRREFYMWVAVYYAVLVVYFFATKLFLDWPDSDLPVVLRYAIGAIVLIATMFLAVRVDLLWLSYTTHRRLFCGEGSRDAITPARFYFNSLSYYVFVIGMGVLLFAARDSIHFLLLYYLLFLYGTIVMSKFDYIVPSYSRYKNLADAGTWGIHGKQSA